MGFRAQAGLEYLITYGWALILIAIVTGVLVFVVGNPASGVIFSSSDPAKIFIRGSAVNGSSAEIILQNLTGGKIDITAIAPTNYTNCTINASNPPIQINDGSTMKLECTAPSDGKGGILIAYTDYFDLQRIVIINAGETSWSGGEPFCGDGTCNGSENALTCPGECPAVCGDGECTGDEANSYSSDYCPVDCPYCGDGTCNGSENALTCPGECPAVCGDGFCTHNESNIYAPEYCYADCYG